MRERSIRLTGSHIIGCSFSRSDGRTFRGVDPAAGRELPGTFREAGRAEADRALKLAQRAFVELQDVPVGRIAGMLKRAASGLEAGAEAIVERAHLETGLPYERLRSELSRTSGQARVFADLILEGSWVQARIDRAVPGRKPLPKPDLRTMMMPIGPVAVFGASNFPLAISVAGTDTVAAFAARCPVIVKGHPAHPGTCELVGRVIAEAVRRSGLPPGMFSLLQASGFEAGLALVRHPLTAAVAFTGSLAGGRALADAAAARPVPIPVYAEMGSVNPVFLLPGALNSRPEEIAEGLSRSLNTGVGQYCTNPGMVIAADCPGFSRFLAALCARARAVPAAPMLHAGIQAAYDRGTARLASIPGVRLAAAAQEGGTGPKKAVCRVFTADVSLISRRPELSEEVFGPATVVYRCRSAAAMLKAADGMKGSLTATVHAATAELRKGSALLLALRRKAGRIVCNGYPTGLEPCHSLHHGGPYPATTHSFFTSVGTAAIYRYVRPVCFQGFDGPGLPEELLEGNPRGIRRLQDGALR
ncbi:MAG: aldehyde dehydrogenase (NADP(+)) [Elusimicrobia bacterium]|nr:aldehyde dehydrogenase (NADP(+)) [Elusimicrobiota bacterium]